MCLMHKIVLSLLVHGVENARLTLYCVLKSAILFLPEIGINPRFQSEKE